MKLSKKAQYSFEFIIVVGAVLALITLSSFFVFQNSAETKSLLSKERSKGVANQIIGAAESVDRLGEGGFKVVEVQMPEGIESIQSKKINYSDGTEEYLLNFTFIDGSNEIYLSDVYIYVSP